MREDGWSGTRLLEELADVRTQLVGTQAREAEAERSRFATAAQLASGMAIASGPECNGGGSRCVCHGSQDHLLLNVVFGNHVCAVPKLVEQ